MNGFAIYDCTTNLILYICVDLMMTQDESKQVAIPQKQGDCFYNIAILIF
jgi:hypothetical protein